MSTFATLYANYPELKACESDINAAFEMMGDCLAKDGTIYIAGNGGSCADADHISGELLKGFIKKRPLSDADKAALVAMDPEEGALLGERLQYGLRGLSLMHLPAPISAVGNDLGNDMYVAQLLLALARPGDVLLGISTSGNAGNIGLATRIARLKGVKVIGLTGSKGGKLKDRSDVCIRVPSDVTFRIQEYHLPVYHALCAELENRFFEK